MKAHLCKSCAAPLPPANERGMVHCSHCGTVYQQEERRSAWAFVVLLGVPAVLVMGAVVVGVLAAGVIGGSATSAVSTVSSRPPTPVASPDPAPPPDDRLPVSRLPELTDMRGWKELDAPGMEGSWEDFDLVANRAWMDGIARSWAADIVLQRLILSGLRADGTLDLSARDDWDVDARYASPTLRRTAVETAKVSEDEVKSEFRMSLSESTITAGVSTATSSALRDELPDPLVLGCTMPELMAAFGEAGVESRPSYELDFQWVGPSRVRANGYWRASLRSSRSGDRIPTIYLDPATCEPQ